MGADFDASNAPSGDIPLASIGYTDGANPIEGSPPFDVSFFVSCELPILERVEPGITQMEVNGEQLVVPVAYNIDPVGPLGGFPIAVGQGYTMLLDAGISALFLMDESSPGSPIPSGVWQFGDEQPLATDYTASILRTGSGGGSVEADYDITPSGGYSGGRGSQTLFFDIPTGAVGIIGFYVRYRQAVNDTDGVPGTDTQLYAAVTMDGNFPGFIDLFIAGFGQGGEQIVPPSSAHGGDAHRGTKHHRKEVTGTAG